MISLMRRTGPPPRRRVVLERLGTVLVAAVALAVTAAGCGASAGRPDTSTSTDPAEASGTGTGPAASGTAAPPAPVQAGNHRYTLTFGGRERSYVVHVPPAPAPAPAAAPASARPAALPVVLVLHGGGGSGDQAEKQTGMSAEADRAGFLAVYPDGTGPREGALLTWNAGTCCGYALRNTVDDVGFISALLDRLARDYPTDPKRIYVTGLSNGGMMAYRIGCELADRVAAIAPVSGALDTDVCAPTRPVPVIAFHGTADQKVRYDGGRSAITQLRSGNEAVDRSVAYAMSFWAGHDRCPATPARTRDGAVVRDVYAPCADGSEVVLYTIEGGGHAWPGGTTQPRAQADPPPPAPDANAVMWDFFSRHSLAD